MSSLALFGVSDPIMWRGLERLAIVFGATLIGYLGYRLYRFGVAEGQTKVNAEWMGAKFLFSGLGPGLAFMAVSGFVLIAALFRGGVGVTTIEAPPAVPQTPVAMTHTQAQPQPVILIIPGKYPQTFQMPSGGKFEQLHMIMNPEAYDRLQLQGSDEPRENRSEPVPPMPQPKSPPNP